MSDNCGLGNKLVQSWSLGLDCVSLDRLGLTLIYMAFKAPPQGMAGG
jgi:hypothetical protein